MNKSICVFPGTFDPFTLGHFDITARAAKIFDSVIVAIGDSAQKRCMFSLKERSELAAEATRGLKNCKVVSFSGLLVDFCKREDVGVIVRGLRTASDLEYENALGAVYKIQDPGIETMYFINSQRYSHIHGTIVRDLLTHSGDISEFVPKNTLPMIKNFSGVK